jgi:hypothetical protein
MVAEDYSWTMVYTHEDFACGGPFFVDRNKLEIPPQERMPPAMKNADASLVGKKRSASCHTRL